MTPARGVGLLALVVLSCGCANVNGYTVRLTPKCADGLPPYLLTDSSCPPDGVCGYSCLPGRWLSRGQQMEDNMSDRKQEPSKPTHPIAEPEPDRDRPGVTPPIVEPDRDRPRPSNPIAEPEPGRPGPVPTPQ